jgi:hypothetical protein
MNSSTSRSQGEVLIWETLQWLMASKSWQNTGWYSCLSWWRPIACFELRVIHRFKWKGIRSITCRPLSQGAAIISKWFQLNQLNNNTEDSVILQTRNIKIHIDWYCCRTEIISMHMQQRSAYERGAIVSRRSNWFYRLLWTSWPLSIVLVRLKTQPLSNWQSLARRDRDLQYMSLIFHAVPSDWDYLPQTGTVQEFLPSPNKTIDFWNYTF